jgi:hypothetical protein
MQWLVILKRLVDALFTCVYLRLCMHLVVLPYEITARLLDTDVPIQPGMTDRRVNEIWQMAHLNGRILVSR